MPFKWGWGDVKEVRTSEECLIISPTFPISRGWAIETYFLWIHTDGTYWGPSLVFMVELTNNSCLPPGIPWVLYVEKEGLAMLIEEMIGP